jgi:hypothetical protein
MVAADDISIDVGAPVEEYWMRGVGRAVRSPSSALPPHHSSGRFKRMLTSADDRHDHETFSLAAIERLDALRDRIRHRGIERRAFSYWGSVKGTVTLDVLRSPFFTLSFGVYASTVLCFAHPAGAEDRALYMTVLTILGAFLSFASIFLNKETYTRFRASYQASLASQSAIFDATTVSRLALRELVGRTVARFLCASYLAAFAGLRDSHYDVDEVLHPFVEKHELLTENEWARLVNRGGFARTGDRYRELIAWAIGVVQRERNRRALRLVRREAHDQSYPEAPGEPRRGLPHARSANALRLCAFGARPYDMLPAGLRVRAGEARLARSRGPRPGERRHMYHLLLFPRN